MDDSARRKITGPRSVEAHQRASVSWVTATVSKRLATAYRFPASAGAPGLPVGSPSAVTPIIRMISAWS
jgi:hypothetical protein